jgi:hypothetical protein
MAGRAVAAAGAPTPPHCSRLQMCGRSPRAPCLFGSSFFLFVSVRSSSNGVRIFLVAVCGSGGESSCYSYSESSNTGSELGLDHVFEMQQLIRTKATSSTDGYSTSDTVQVCTTLRSHSDSCASSGARAGDLRAVAVGRENRCTSVSRIFALFCCRETWPPRPRAPTSHTFTGRYLFSPCLSVGCLILEAAARFLLTLASAGFAKKKPWPLPLALRSSGSVQCAKTAAPTVQGKRKHSGLGLCTRWMQSPGSFSWQRTVYPFHGGDSPPSRRCLNHSVAYRLPIRFVRRSDA